MTLNPTIKIMVELVTKKYYGLIIFERKYHEKNNKCPKCESENIVVIKNDGHPDATYGNNIQTKITILSGIVYVNRYICCNCGYSEEWIDQNDIKSIMESKKIKKLK